MFGFWKAHKARKAAADAITPFVGQTRQRFGDIPESAWSNAYVIGFVTTLITLFANRDAGALGDSLLASVQAGAWSDITQSESVLLGDEVCFLSTAGDGIFELGCRNAIAFFEALDAASLRREEGRFDIADAEPDGYWALAQTGGDSCAGLWMNYFDAYVGRASALGG
jgi:hypothetical protein